MQDTNNLLDFVIAEFRGLAKRIEQKDSSISGELRLLSKLLERIKYSSPVEKPQKNNLPQNKQKKEETTLFNENQTIPQTNALKPVAALKEFFKAQPQSKFETTPIKEFLLSKYSKGELLTNSTDIAITMHSALRDLVKQEFLIKDSSGLNAVYSLNENYK
jgi:hypothetical protein